VLGAMPAAGEWAAAAAADFRSAGSI
jgi:hypothetical protein